MGDRYRSRDDNVEYYGGGESYRPGGHSGGGPYRPPNRQATDTWSSDRRDRERDRDRDRERDPRREDVDSYVPPTRRRSRTPPPARRGDLFDDRPPRRDDRPRSPPRRRSRSPYSRRSPEPRRAPSIDRRERDGYNRHRSPPTRGHSPPRGSRGGRYRSRSRTPPPRRDPYNDESWRRPRSPSPRPNSSVPSRRSSPPVHPDRLKSVSRSPAYDTTMTDAAPGSSYDRPIPTGPSMSAHNRGGGMTSRGARGGGHGGPRDFSSPIRGRGSLSYRSPVVPRSTSYSDAPPAGPRAGGSYRGDFGPPRRGDYGGTPRTFSGSLASNEAVPAFRGNNSSSSTYPRTQRFNTAQTHLNGLAKITPGGALLPSGLTPDQERKLRQLEAEADRMRAELAEKQKGRRDATNEWEVRERESEREALRSELAQKSLDQLTGDEVGTAAF